MTIAQSSQERVGKFTLTVQAAPETPDGQTTIGNSEGQDQWQNRSEVLAAWLLVQWQLEQATVAVKEVAA